MHGVAPNALVIWVLLRQTHAAVITAEGLQAATFLLPCVELSRWAEYATSRFRRSDHTGRTCLVCASHDGCPSPAGIAGLFVTTGIIASCSLPAFRFGLCLPSL